MRGSKRYKKSTLIKICSIFICVIIFHGCSGVSYQNMIADSNEINNKFSGSVRVEVDEEKVDDWYEYTQFVHDGDVKRAIEESLEKSNLFTAVTQSVDADYLLKVEITSIGHFWGLTAKKAYNTLWTLTNINKDKDVWKDVVRSEGIATVEDSFGGYKRGCIAYERAIKENIYHGINQLSDSLSEN